MTNISDFLRWHPKPLAFLVARQKIWPVILLGLAVRELFAPITGHPFDFEIWIRLGYYVSRGFDPYTPTSPVPNLSFPGAGTMNSIGYPPLWAFFQAGLYTLYSMSGINDRFVYYFIIKQPMIFGDLAAAFLIFRVVLTITKDEVRSTEAFQFWLLCPYTIVISSMWGMFDQLALDLALIAILTIARTRTSAVIEGVGILLKAIPLIFLPVFAFAQKKKSQMVAYTAVSLAVFLSFTLLPYAVFSNWSFSNIQGTGVDIAAKVGNSINYWVVVFAIVNLGYEPTSLVVSVLKLLSYAWIPSVIAASFYCAPSLLRNDLSLRGLLACSVFVLLVFYVTRLTVSEQYVIYFLGLGLVLVYAVSGPAGRAHRMWIRSFHGVWLSALVFLVANNTFMVRFFTPLSIYFVQLGQKLDSGVSGDIRLAIMVVAGFSFTIFCIRFLVLTYSEVFKKKSTVLTKEKNSGKGIAIGI